MWRSKFAYVLSFIFISSVSSSSMKNVLVSFDDFCSNDLLCHTPLICSNSSQCICPKSSTFWNTKLKTCLYCSSESMEWQHEKCLSFIAPYEGGVIHQKARNTCLTYSAQLLQIKNLQDLVQFQYKTIESEHALVFNQFFSHGVWINLTDGETNSYDWCDMNYEYEMSSSKNCIRLMKKSSDDNVASFCLDHVDCNEKLLYICERLAEIVDDNDETRTFGDINLGLDSIFQLLSNSLGSMQQQQPAVVTQNPQPQIQVIREPQPQQPSSASSQNIIIYVGLFILIIVIVVIIMFCFIGAFLYLRQNNRDLSMDEEA